jgi:uncharacterized membrane-anchored protein
MKHRLKRLANDALGLGALVLLLAALVGGAFFLTALQVQWCVAVGGDRATCAAMSTLPGRR